MPVADLILTNANVITMDAAIPKANTIAVYDDKITLASNDSDIKVISGKNTIIVDCHQKTVLPGFIDAHCHLFSVIRKLTALDLSPEAVTSIADIQNTIRDKVRQTVAGQWIAGTGYNEFYLKEKRHPTCWELDEVSPDNPVVIAHRSLHSCVLNSYALRLAGIDNETEEMPGTRIERDFESGEPNGLLYEMLGYIREKIMPPVTMEDLDHGARLANDQYLSYGITSLQDASITNDINRWKSLKRIMNEGIFKSRVAMMTSIENLSQFQDAGFFSGYHDGDMAFIGIKIIPSESTGILYPPQDELNEIVLKMYKQGLPVAVHAVTGEMVAAVVTAFESMRRKLPENKLHCRIEHCSECPPELLKRMQVLKPVIVSQPPFVYYSGDRYLSIIEKDKIPWLYRYKSFWDSGMLTAAGSDAPVVPFDPLAGIYAAVTRRTRSGAPFVPEERISVNQAVAMYTINAAYVSGEEKIKGSISPGKLADMVVLSDDPFSIDPEKIKDIKVDMTIMGGKIVYEATT